MELGQLKSNLENLEKDYVEKESIYIKSDSQLEAIQQILQDIEADLNRLSST